MAAASRSSQRIRMVIFQPVLTERFRISADEHRPLPRA
jgi:hypothetical protein